MESQRPWKSQLEGQLEDDDRGRGGGRGYD